MILAVLTLLLAFPVLGGGAVAPRDADVERLAGMLEGSFRSTAQAAQDPDYRDVRLVMARCWRERDDGPWLYVEQAMAATPDAPYRQRVYQLSRREDGAFESRVYELAAPEASVGAWRRERPLDGLSPADLALREGCEMALRSRPDGSFEGRTGVRTCPSALSGAAYATSEVIVTQTRISSWDRGFAADGTQVWGAKKGAYVFVRERK